LLGLPEYWGPLPVALPGDLRSGLRRSAKGLRAKPRPGLPVRPPAGPLLASACPASATSAALALTWPSFRLRGSRRRLRRGLLKRPWTLEGLPRGSGLCTRTTRSPLGRLWFGLLIPPTGASPCPGLLSGPTPGTVLSGLPGLPALPGLPRFPGLLPFILSSTLLLWTGLPLRLWGPRKRLTKSKGCALSAPSLPSLPSLPS